MLLSRFRMVVVHRHVPLAAALTPKVSEASLVLCCIRLLLPHVFPAFLSCWCHCRRVLCLLLSSRHSLVRHNQKFDRCCNSTLHQPQSQRIAVFLLTDEINPSLPPLNTRYNHIQRRGHASAHTPTWRDLAAACRSTRTIRMPLVQPNHPHNFRPQPCLMRFILSGPTVSHTHLNLAPVLLSTHGLLV